MNMKPVLAKKRIVKDFLEVRKISRDQKAQHLYSGNPSEITLIWHGSVEGLQQENYRLSQKE